MYCCYKYTHGTYGWFSGLIFIRPIIIIIMKLLLLLNKKYN